MSTDGSQMPPREGLARSTGESTGAPANLGAISERGLVYLFAGSSITKVIVFVAQILVLHLVAPEALGIFTLAFTITTFILIIGQSGVTDVLVHRRAFRQWAIPGFWLALALGLLSSLLIGISAPLAARFFYTSDPTVRDRLFWLLIASVPAPLPYALSVVPKAQLSRQLRFRALSAVNVVEATLQSVLTLLFAWLGLKEFSFVLPIWIGGFLLAAILWWWARPPWAPRLGLRRWRYLIGDSTQLLASEYGRQLLDQSDNMSLGLFQVNIARVGDYANGFRFSIQTMRLLMVNMTTILFPAFTKLNDQPQKQYEGFMKAQRLLAMVGVSGCLLQAAAADAFAHLLFPPDWFPSIIVMQILSLGMATRMVAGGSFALLKSHGRFKTIRNNFWAYAVVQVVALVTVLAMGGEIVAVSIVVSIVAAFAGPIMFYYAIRPYGGGLAEVSEVLTRPLVCGILSVGTAWLIALGMGSDGQGRLVYLLQLVEICVVAVVLNCLLARLWMRPVWDDLWLRLRRMLPQRATA